MNKKHIENLTKLLEEKEYFVTADYKGEVYQVISFGPSGSVGIYHLESPVLEYVTPQYVTVIIPMTSEPDNTEPDNTPLVGPF